VTAAMVRVILVSLVMLNLGAMGSFRDFTSDELAGRVALIALRAGMQQRELTDGKTYVIYPDTTVVTWGEAVKLLASQPKPLRCDALASGSAVMVRCRGISDPVLLEVQEKSATEAIDLFGHGIQRHSGNLVHDPLILVRGYNEWAVVPWTVLERWFRDYRVTPHAMATRPPDTAAARKGARAVIQFDQGDFYPLDAHGKENR